MCAFMFSICTSVNASVVSRTNSRRPAASESRMPTMAVRIDSETKQTKTKNESEYTEPTNNASEYTEPEETIEEEDEIIEDKTTQFDEVIEDMSSSADGGKSSLAEKIRAQRAAMDAEDKISSASQQIQSAMASGKNACDQGLRTCMQQKCGKDYSKCAGDTDTIWGDKMDSCRRDLPCTGHEYALFTTEIKADRDMNVRIAGYNSIIECGNTYNECIFTECGATFAKCLGKSAGDKAIQKCAKIAKNCTQQDSGLASRMMSAFGAVRQDAEKAVQRDEKRLYELRDAMASTCKRLGAMFDERTLDCVYTVNFYAGEKNTLYASKKAYAGGTFSCDQNWFGVDITTFKENAFRATREQSSATSALMGAGVGTAVGAVTSGAIDRAIDRSKAEKALKKAEKEHEENYGKKGEEEEEEEEENSPEDNKPGAAQKRCEKANGTWSNNKCTGASCKDGYEWNDSKNKCKKIKKEKSTKKTKNGDENTDTSGQNLISVQGIQNSMKKDPFQDLKRDIEAPQLNLQTQKTMDEINKFDTTNMKFNVNMPTNLSQATGGGFGGLGAYATTKPTTGGGTSGNSTGGTSGNTTSTPSNDASSN